jgi:hypothetical protein
MTPAAKTSDPLIKTVEEILAHAKEEGFFIFYGLACGSEENSVHWNEEHGGDWKKFLESAKGLGVRGLYFDWTPFEEFQIDEALHELPAHEESQMSTAEIEEYNRAVEKYRERVGSTAIIDLAFAVDGVFHIYQLAADWFTAFEELTAEEEEAEPVEHQVDKQLVNKWASVLANHPKFGSCKNDDQREYLLEQLAGEDCGALPLGEILRRAETLYVFDVRPRQEEDLQKQAKQMRKQGLNMNAIALKLGISRDRVSGLLAD